MTQNTAEPTVFIVDDDQEVREAIHLLMRSVGLEARSFASGQAYLEQFDASRPGCLILDVRMKGMSGLDLQERLSGEPVHPPIIIITGHGDVPMAVRAVRGGAVDFIEKPFNDQTLLDAVHRAFDLDARNRGQASRLADIQERLARLTPREREILDQVIAGKRNGDLAGPRDQPVHGGGPSSQGDGKDGGALAVGPHAHDDGHRPRRSLRASLSAS
jgi:two-component system, LuxR family, response regulator FixJ